MKRPHQVVVEQAHRVAAELPPALVLALAEAIERAGGWEQPGAALTSISQPHYRALAADLLCEWRDEAPTVTAEAVALALLSAAEAERRRREESIELVWTGPDAQVVPTRHTEQALLQVIDAAAERLLLVSYAVYKVPRVCQALVRAADRGVRLRIVVEAGDRQGSHTVRSKLVALGQAVAERAEVYYWPAERRQRSAAEGEGVLHVKAAAADGRLLLFGSANLTESAFTLNMELGALTSGGALAGQVERIFDRLIGAGVLVTV